MRKRPFTYPVPIVVLIRLELTDLIHWIAVVLRVVIFIGPTIITSESPVDKFFHLRP
jgi:hypothetical protein